MGFRDEEIDRIDEDILEWFRAQARGYQTQINALLRAYVEAHRSR